jgi:hypothetical protein
MLFVKGQYFELKKYLHEILFNADRLPFHIPM